MMVVLVDKLLKTQIVEPSAVANWLFSSEMQPEFTKYARFMLSFMFYNVHLSDIQHIGFYMYTVLHVLLLIFWQILCLGNHACNNKEDE